MYARRHGREPCRRSGACMNRNTYAPYGARSFKCRNPAAPLMAQICLPSCERPLSYLSFLNPHETLRAEIVDRRGKSIVAISRWKKTTTGRVKRTGATFEFGAHRIAGMAELVADVQRVVGADGGLHEHRPQNHFRKSPANTATRHSRRCGGSGCQAPCRTCGSN